MNLASVVLDTKLMKGDPLLERCLYCRCLSCVGRDVGNFREDPREGEEQ